MYIGIIIMALIILSLLVWQGLRERNKVKTFTISFKEVGWVVYDKEVEVKAKDVLEAFRSLGIEPRSCFNRFDAKYVVMEGDTFIGYFR